jgi:uncharacterized protein YlxW (UPF0749 family)
MMNDWLMRLLLRREVGNTDYDTGVVSPDEGKAEELSKLTKQIADLKEEIKSLETKANEFEALSLFAVWRKMNC